MLVHEFLENSAGKLPDKVALITETGRYNYRLIEEKSRKISEALMADGLNKGDRVAVFMDNSLDAVAGIFGILKAGGVFVIINPTTKVDKLTYILNHCQASMMFSSQDKLSMITKCLRNILSLKSIYVSGYGANLVDTAGKRIIYLKDIFCGKIVNPAAPVIRATDLASIIYTSGSTGVAKGVVMTHHNMVSSANSITQYLRSSSSDIVLSALPLSFDYGLYQVIMAFKVGATVILKKAFGYPYRALETIVKEKVTGFPIVPTISALITKMENLKNMKFDCLRYITNTGDALPADHIKKLRKIFPKTKIYSMYGLTECKRVTYLDPDQIESRPTSVGKPMPGVETFVVDNCGKSVGPNVVGELVVKGPNVMQGYWNMPDETDKFLKYIKATTDRVLFTGDLFHYDKEGFLYFVGRKGEMIKSCGEKVSPKEVENVIHGMPSVSEVAVVGVDDPVLGQAIKAYVVKVNEVDITNGDIKKYCAKRLEDHMVPKYIEFRSSLPRTETGKVSKSALI
ncbi:MAG TPA: AMP-dependent synthetase [Nitrospirae bacterium]|nr:AMP-dependent synthetase [Nitrospirota bacterium]